MKIILLGSIVLLCIASYYDLKYRVIPNLTSAGLIILGLLYHILNNGLEGLKISLSGMIIGFVFFVVLYLLKMMGAGDVKLGAGAGSILGIKIIPAIVLIVLVGGVIAIIQIITFIINKRLKSNNINNQIEGRSMGKELFKQSVPYGLAISIGTVLTLILY